MSAQSHLAARSSRQLDRFKLARIAAILAHQSAADARLVSVPALTLKVNLHSRTGRGLIVRLKAQRQTAELGLVQLVVTLLVEPDANLSVYHVLIDRDQEVDRVFAADSDFVIF
jgi:hypothetical protein